tara:strand:+ start:1548 stop:3095 length:1548 start_codon:yes stop_codon:yes gene_type:complete
MKSVDQQRILILDFGSQYTQLIARRIREIGVYCEIWSWQSDKEEIAAFQPSGLILSGGPESVMQEDAPHFHTELFELALPILGICYGLQAVVHQQGGHVKAGSHVGEFGRTALEQVTTSDLFQGVDQHLEVWMSHGDQIQELPQGFVTLAKTAHCPHAVVYHEALQFYGLQFHPEVTHTQQGLNILENFAQRICQCAPMWRTEKILEQIITRLRVQIGTGRVLLGLSGGVDSSVTALLLQKAIGSRLQCVFVDHGLLRLNEVEEVKDSLGQGLGLNIDVVDARSKFMQGLEGISDPEMKRKIIGRLFVEVFEERARSYENMSYLAQGTIYPDVIESAGNKHAHLIKSHHNVGGLPETLSLQLVEPLRELFKDEVRQLGLALGLKPELISRHPFPGPGLGVRILGEIKEEYCHILRQADAIFLEVLTQYDMYHKVSQAFAVFLPVRSVGVKGDGRCYDWVIALRAVETLDFMTARWAHLPYDLLDEASHRIMNEVRGVSRVVYDISGKPPATIEWE